ncbi:peptidoglycan-binding domain-containing protein [Nocardiopsis synnemataformans]|uniref:peptidoglycan-binding domain-containing protein n=1 Tax=Nocardiopsis synnemataformans TaxID=61305 RepID=UPI003EBE3AD3
MSLLLDNTLSGEPGVQVSAATLAASAALGTITLGSAGPRAVYDDAYTVHGRPAIRISSGYHRGDTPRLRVTLPAAPWSIRFYLWHPSIPHSTGERRWVAALAGMGLVTYENASAQIGSRLQPNDLAAAEHTASFSGPAPGPAQWLRVEMACTGTSTTVRFYPGHQPDAPRQMVFTQAPAGPMDLTAYRLRKRNTLYWGDQGTEVRDLQLELLDLGYDLGPAGADGDFGNATLSAVQSFQSTRGLSPVDGVPGPETRAAMDLALGRVPAPMWVSHLAVATGEWIGPAAPPPVPTTPRALRPGPLPI